MTSLMPKRVTNRGLAQIEVLTILSALFVASLAGATVYGHVVARRYQAAAIALGARETSTRPLPPDASDTSLRDDGADVYEGHLMLIGDKRNHVEVGKGKRIVVVPGTGSGLVVNAETSGVVIQAEDDPENTPWGTVSAGRRTSFGGSDVSSGIAETTKDGKRIVLAKTPRAGVSAVKHEVYRRAEFDVPGYHVELETAGSVDVGLSVGMPVDGGFEYQESADGKIEITAEGSLDLVKLAALGIAAGTAALGLFLAAGKLNVGSRIKMTLTPKRSR